ncbi:galactose mutarotase-like protein [Pluteus cervinus]|uniref:Galactose mutarotase-like protein n=1 Tax=Pluteus cervinus TaxID=181527 RepID=A0ACD3A1M9_9AGAR|nr:galactose mutarotase-like protein [Pluteus cervinus]
MVPPPPTHSPAGSLASSSSTSSISDSDSLDEAITLSSVPTSPIAESKTASKSLIRIPWLSKLASFIHLKQFIAVMLGQAQFWFGALLGLRLVGLGWAISTSNQQKVKTSPSSPFDGITLSAPDGSVTAKFVSFGATLTELWVKDKFGKARDVVLGYDDNSRLMTDPDHPVFNPIVGRYANRLAGGTFSIPITKNPQPDGPNVYHIPTNDHDGQVTLHGGLLGWDRRNWTVVAHTPTSVTFKHVDEAHEGFPGTVTAYATHTVSNGGTLKTTVRATATEKTPIMLTQHVYWNLDAYKSSSGSINATSNILDHHLQVSGSRVIALDSNAIPTGEFINVEGTPFDFRKSSKIGARWVATTGLCGGECQGYDSCWIYDRPESGGVKTSLWSDRSGIRVDISTNQPAVQVYTSYWLNTPRKAVHGGPDLKYDRWSAVAIEQQGYVDAINTPEFGVDQIYSPERPFEWSTSYKFSTVH